VSSAAAGPTAATGRRGRRLLPALLVVSVALNLFFVVGAVWTRLHHPPGWPNREERYQQLAKRLDLEPSQRAGFDRFVAAMRTRDENVREQIAPLVSGAWDELAKPQPDAGLITRRFDEASAKWREFQREATLQTLDFLAMLSPAQRAEFVAEARERRASWMRRRALKH
jgi:uncharacterized membrane protein